MLISMITRYDINKKLVELGRRRDGVWQRQVTEILLMIDKYTLEQISEIKILNKKG